MLILGTREKNVVEVTDCFTVPHNETDQEVCFVDLQVYLLFYFA